MKLMQRSRVLSLLALTMTGAFSSGCPSTESPPSDDGGGSSSDGGSKGGGGGTKHWLVGQSGLMLAVGEDDARVGRYPLTIVTDLRAIACWGAARAWVAGAGGAVLTTEDAGATWRRVDIGVQSTLQ